MADFAQAAVALEPAEAPTWLRPVNERGRKQWRAQPFPTRKTEAWKYTSLKDLRETYLRWPQPAAPAGLEKWVAIPGLSSCRVVFVNGYFSPELSSGELPSGVELVRFAEADDAQRQRIEKLLGSIADGKEHLFAALNESWLRDGLYLRVAQNTRVETPIQVVALTTADEQEFTVQERLLVDLERGAEATVIEQFTSTDQRQNSFTNGITEIELGANARLTHYRLHMEQEHALHIGGVHVNLERDATLDSFMMALGSTLQRVDVVVNHRGSGAHCELNGMYLPTGEQHVDFHTCIEHRVPHCTSNEVFRGIIGDKARAVFNGRIHIHPDAQQTQAQLSNKNLLTSRDAEVDTKPELEIYADDVKCAHGATVAQLDTALLHYLRARGISAEEAAVMLKFGFINELLLGLKHEPVRDWLQQSVEGMFADRAELARHLP